MVWQISLIVWKSPNEQSSTICFCSIVRKFNRLKNSTTFLNECTSKLKNIKQGYDWKLERPLLRFTPAFVGKLITRSSNKIQFWCVDFNSSFKRMTFGSEIRILKIWLSLEWQKKNLKIDFLGKISTKHLWFDFNPAIQRRFVLERKVIYKQHFTSLVLFHLKNETRKPSNSCFCSDLWQIFHIELFI